jgi:hypothetical protein
MASLVVVAIDCHPILWGNRADESTAGPKFWSVVDEVFVFAKAHKLLGSRNRLAVLAFNQFKSSFLWFKCSLL